MGLFTHNQYSRMGSYAEIPADESYTYPMGYSRIIAESAQNDFALFSALIQGDFEEEKAIQEGYAGFAPQVVLEAAGGIFGKIIQFFKTFIAKIKGIITSFIVKIETMCGKDNKKLYDKYKKLVANARWEGCKVKWSKPKASGNNSNSAAISALINYDETIISGAITELTSYAHDLGITYPDSGSGGALEKNDFTEQNLQKFEDDTDDHKAEEHFLKQFSGMNNVDFEDFEKDFHEENFEDEEILEGGDSDFSSMKQMVISVMSDNGKEIRKLEKSLGKLDHDAQKIVDGFYNTSEKIQNIASKAGTNTDTNDNSEDIDVDYAITSDTSGGGTGTNKGYADNGVTSRFSSKTTKLKVSNSNRTTSGANSTKVNVDAQSMVRLANCQYRLASYWQSAVNLANKCTLDAIKFHVQQCRSAWAALVAHAASPKNKIIADNSQAYLAMVQEAEEYEFNSDFALM